MKRQEPTRIVASPRLITEIDVVKIFFEIPFDLAHFRR